MIIDILSFFLAAGLLWFGADWIVDAAAAIARRFNVSELLIGLTVVAMGTSAPEFLVTFTAALKGMNDISLSNIVGSNIFNLGIILGLVAWLRPVPTHRAMLTRDGSLLICVVALIALFAYSGDGLARWEGFTLLAILISYLVTLAVRRPKDIPLEEIDDQHKATWKDYPKLLAGFVAVSGGGTLMVEAATNIASAMGVSTWAIGVTIVAAGTSLPELVTCLAASIKGKNDILVGNLIGSDLFNFAGVLGITSLLKPLVVSPDALTNLCFAVGAIGLVLIFVRTGWKISRVEGALLVFVGLLRWVPSIF